MSHASGDDPRLSVIIPVYNSSTSLVELADRLHSVLADLVPDSFEILFVDDRSPHPDSWATLATLAAERPYVTAVQLTRNFGKPGAVLCGMSLARGQWVVTMDDDLQHRPEDIPLLWAERSHDVVIGNFPVRRQWGLAALGSRFKRSLDQLLIGLPKSLRVSPFKLYRMEIVRAMTLIETPHPFIAALMLEVTKDIMSVDVTHERRKYGKSQFTLAKRFRQTLNLLVNNSALLLNAVAVFGVVASLSSFALGGYLVLRRFVTHVAAPGWTSLIVVQLLMGGLLLFSLGIVGEYLLRIIRGIERRPPFSVRSRLGSGFPPPSEE